MATVLQNGRAYDFGQVIVNILGVPVVGVSSISYTMEQEKTNNFGQGYNPVSRGKGAKNASASIEISMNDVEAIRDVAPAGDLTEIPAFDIVVTYLNDQKPVTHVLKSCEFTDDGVETSQGDTDIRRTFNLVVATITYRG